MEITIKIYIFLIIILLKLLPISINKRYKSKDEIIKNTKKTIFKNLKDPI